MGRMSKGSTPNFVVNWLNNKELQYTLAAETLLQVSLILIHRLKYNQHHRDDSLLLNIYDEEEFADKYKFACKMYHHLSMVPPGPFVN